MTGRVWPVVGFTGHRGIPPAQRLWVLDHLTRVVRWLAAECGTHTVVSGLAIGGDTWWAQAGHDAGLRLWAMVPFQEQPARWTRAQRADWDRLRFVADRVDVVGELPAGWSTWPTRDRSRVVNGLLFARNDRILDVSSAVVGLWDPARSSGGTHDTLVRARRRGMPGIHLNPARPGVRMSLPPWSELRPEPVRT